MQPISKVKQASTSILEPSTTLQLSIAWTPYMTAISKIIAKNQITQGGPSKFCNRKSDGQSPDPMISIVILVQAENEFSASAANNIYMQAIIDLYRANGIVVRTLGYPFALKYLS